MCGISGIIGENASSIHIKQMTNLLSHRGNDSTGHYVDNNIALGHNRLSIIDLNSEANQPFKSKNYPHILIFNGEIYNYFELRSGLEKLGYLFETKSDTEVLLKSYIEWGEQCLNKLNGMFAFAIWNPLDNTLFVARDRFGVKPLYYYLDDKNFIFSSEIKAIRQFYKTEIDEVVLANYLSYGSYGSPNETFFKAIKQLQGGHYLKFKDSNISITQWYHFVDRVKVKIHQNKSLKENEAIDKYKAILEKSISLRFRADVPVSIALSGGVDSSLLLALVNQRKDCNKVSAFTFYTDDLLYDELPWVKKMVKQTGTTLNPVLFTPEDFKEWHSKIKAIQEEPYGGIPTLAYAKLFNKTKEFGYKVILDGQGMDEAWAGYDYYLNKSSATIQGQFNINPYKTNVLTSKIKTKASKPTYPKPFNNSLLDKQYRDLFYTKIPRALRFNDRVSMASTVELREPFLDYELVEFAFSLPEKFKIKNGQGKYLLRKLLYLHNESLAFAPKRALQTPQREWLGDSLAFAVDKAIQTIQNSSIKSFFNIEEMYKEWDLYKKGNKESSFHLWQWISVSDLINSL